VTAIVLSQKVPKGEKHWNLLGPKQKAALELYDELREKAGFDAWDVIYHTRNTSEPEPLRCTVLVGKLNLTSRNG
jgi:hypothetical protein